MRYISGCGLPSLTSSAVRIKANRGAKLNWPNTRSVNARTLLVAIAFRMPADLERIQQLNEPRHAFQLCIENPGENHSTFGGQDLDRVRQLMPVDHHLQRDVRPPPHDLIEQIGPKCLPAPPQQFAADLLIKLLGVEHQTVEIEHNGLERRNVRHGNRRDEWRAMAGTASLAHPVRPCQHYVV